jgi:hypothetical protein
MPLDLGTLCERIEARLVALDASAWAQTGYGSAWHVPVTGLVQADGQIAGHLAIEVGVKSAPLAGGRSHSDEESQHSVQVEVMFSFHRRPGCIVTDEHTAYRAAGQLWAAMHKDWMPADLVVEGADACQPMYPGNREWIIISQIYSIFLELPMGGV